MTTKNKETAKSKKSSVKKIGFLSTDLSKSSGRPMKGRDVLVKALENEGVKVIFGYPGGASMEIHQGLTLTKKSVWFCLATNKAVPLQQEAMPELPEKLEYALQHQALELQTWSPA